MKWKCQIARPKPGVLSYRERASEYHFPIFEAEGDTVFVAWPTEQRVLYFLLGGWIWVPKQFTEAQREHITSRVVAHLREQGNSVRVLTRTPASERAIEFHPELFEAKGRASELLDDLGLTWFSDYSSIDLLHEEFGLEVCGIQDEAQVTPIYRALQRGFPHWHYGHACWHNRQRDPGWTVSIHLFPQEFPARGH